MISPELQWKILSRVNNALSRLSRRRYLGLSLSLSRIKAHKSRKVVVKENGTTVVDKNLVNEIKSYCINKFGSDKHWPWIALYTEMRGEYKKGWIPADYYRFNLLKKYNPEAYSLISTKKCFDHRLFSDFSLRPVLTRVSNVYYDSDDKPVSEKAATALLHNMDQDIVLKRDGGCGGYGLHFTHSGSIKLPGTFSGDDILIQPLIKQCRELHDLHPESVNTLRVFSFMNKSGHVDILVTVLRFGIGKSRCDGIDAGGGFCRIGEDGRPDPVWYDSRGLPAGKTHPDTGIELSTFKIPSIDAAIRKCRAAHKSYPYVKFIGWDVAINEDHQPVLLEWNARHPGFAFFEALFGPLLKETDL